MEEYLTKTLFVVLPVVIWALLETVALAFKGAQTTQDYLANLGGLIGTSLIIGLSALLALLWAVASVEVLL